MLLFLHGMTLSALIDQEAHYVRHGLAAVTQAKCATDPRLEKVHLRMADTCEGMLLGIRREIGRKSLVQ